MTAGRPARDALADRIRRAIADAEVGRDVLPAGLASLRAVDIDVAGNAVTVTVTLPIPSEAVRTVLDEELCRLVGDLDGVGTVECRFDTDIPDSQQRVEMIPDVKHVVAVASGKGGVGKSTVAVNLATSLASAGAAVGLLDADVYGPNAPAMLGLPERKPDATLDDRMIPREAKGVKAMSMGFISGEDDPVIWRGPLVDDFLKQLFADVEWGRLDYLVVDLPPGTGDAQLSIVQHLPVTGAAIVTTPQSVAVEDASRGLRGFRRYDVPVLGIVENMAGFECPDCGSQHDIFDAGGGATLGAEFDVPVLGRVPIDPAIGTAGGDEGRSDPPGLTIPGIGRLQLPRTRSERGEQTNTSAMVGAEMGTETRRSFELMSMRTAARINAVSIQRSEEAETA